MTNISSNGVFKIVYMPVFPWSVESDNPTKFGGIIKKIVTLFTEKLNISYQMIESHEWSKVNKENGKWNGMMKQLLNKELDLLVGPTVVGSKHVEDFRTLPFFYQAQYLVLASTSSQKPTNLFSFLMTFSIEIWYWIGITLITLVAASTLNDIVLSKRTGWKTPFRIMISNYFWTYIAAFFQEGSPRSPESTRNRFLFSTWLLGMIVLLNSFSGQFKALLMVRSTGELMADANDMAKKPELLTQFPDYYTFYECLRESELESYKTLWKSVLKHGVKKAAFDVINFHSPRLYQNVKDGKATMLADPTIIKINFAKMCHGLKGSRTIYYINGVCGSFNFGFIASPKMDDRIYKTIFKRLRWIMESYLVDKWINDESRDLWKCFQKPDYNDATPLTMKNLSGAFLLLIILDFMALLVFIGEIINSKIDKSKRLRYRR